MTKFQAIYVKLLRCRYGYSWRTIHSLYQLRYTPKELWWHNKAYEEIIDLLSAMDIPIDGPDGNQYEGKKLCDEAMELLNETWNDEETN